MEGESPTSSLIIPIIRAKKIYTKYDKICIIHTKIIIVERNLELNNLGFLYYSAKVCPDLSGFIYLIFQSLYHTSLTSPKQEIYETVNFQNFRKLFKNRFAAIFVAFWHPIFQREKQNEVTGHMKHAAIAVICTLHWGSWFSYKKIVIIKMNNMLYF